MNKLAVNAIRRINIEFTKDVILPRFKMKKGDAWEVRPDRLEKTGFALGGGFVSNDQFKVTGLKRKLR